MNKRSKCLAATEWNCDDEAVSPEETGILTVKELGERYGLIVHDILSNPSNPDLRVGFASTGREKV